MLTGQCLKERSDREWKDTSKVRTGHIGRRMSHVAKQDSGPWEQPYKHHTLNVVKLATNHAGAWGGVGLYD